MINFSPPARPRGVRPPRPAGGAPRGGAAGPAPARPAGGRALAPPAGRGGAAQTGGVGGADRARPGGSAREPVSRTMAAFGPQPPPASFPAVLIALLVFTAASVAAAQDVRRVLVL